MDWYRLFLKSNGPALKCQPVTKSDVQKYQGKLPDSYLSFWQKNGSCGYAKGFFWTIYPSDLLDEMREFLRNRYKKAVPFARTALGDIFFWNENKVHHLNIQNGNVSDGVDDIDSFFGYLLTDKEYLDDILGRRIYNAALRKLGIPENDECYAFVPALALGGSGKADTLQKVKLREYLAILAALLKKR